MSYANIIRGRTIMAGGGRRSYRDMAATIMANSHDMTRRANVNRVISYNVTRRNVMPSNVMPSNVSRRGFRTVFNRTRRLFF